MKELILGLSSFTTLLSLAAFVVSFVILLVQLGKESSTRKIWGAATGTSALVFVLSFVAVNLLYEPKENFENEVLQTVSTTENTISTTESAAPVDTTLVSSTTEIVTEMIITTEEETEKTEAEKFAEKYDVSVALAENIEEALLQCPHQYSLKKIYKWTRTDDYIDGQRYRAWVNMDYIWIFYVQGDRVVSVRDGDNGLKFLYDGRTEEEKY